MKALPTAMARLSTSPCPSPCRSRHHSRSCPHVSSPSRLPALSPSSLRRSVASSLALLFSSSIAALSTATLAAAPPTTAPSTQPTTAPVAAPARGSELIFDATPLADVLEFLRTSCRVNLFIDWRKLEAAGVTRDTPVTLRVRGVTLRKTLELILSGTGADPPLGFTVAGGVITISTSTDIESRPVSRVYDITDLLIFGNTGAWTRDRDNGTRR